MHVEAHCKAVPLTMAARKVKPAGFDICISFFPYIAVQFQWSCPKAVMNYILLVTEHGLRMEMACVSQAPWSVFLHGLCKTMPSDGLCAAVGRRFRTAVGSACVSCPSHQRAERCKAAETGASAASPDQTKCVSLGNLLGPCAK